MSIINDMNTSSNPFVTHNNMTESHEIMIMKNIVNEFVPILPKTTNIDTHNTDKDQILTNLMTNQMNNEDVIESLINDIMEGKYNRKEITQSCENEDKLNNGNDNNAT